MEQVKHQWYWTSSLLHSYVYSLWNSEVGHLVCQFPILAIEPIVVLLKLLF